MFLVELNGSSIDKKPVEGREFEGLGLKKSEVIKHLEELRALGYSILNALTLGNAKLSFSLVN